MMTNVNPTNNPVPSDHPADARDNFKRIDEVVNLQAPQTNPTRTGKTLNTLYGIESKYIASPINGGVWASGVEFTAYNQYMAYNGVTYKPSFSTSLPYTTQGGDPTSAPDSQFVEPFSELNSSNISDFSKITYRESLGSTSVDNMISESPVGVEVGDICSTGLTFWKKISENSPLTINDFIPVSEVYADDFGANGDGVFDNTIILSSGDFSLKLTKGRRYLVTSTSPTINLYGEGVLVYGGNDINVPIMERFEEEVNGAIDRFFRGNSVNLEVDRYDEDIIIELNGADTGDANNWSLRESAFIYHEQTRTWYCLADAVNLDSPYYPNTYDTEIHLFKCTDVETLLNWSYLGVAIEKGSSGEIGEFGVASCSGAAVWKDGRIYAPFSARNNGAPNFDGRTIGLAYSNSNPDTLPWIKLPDAIISNPGEDDDPAALVCDGDDRLHVYCRTTAPYSIVHSSSLTPREASSWRGSNLSIDISTLPGTTAIELTSAFVLDGVIHLYGMEQGPGIAGIRQSHWISSDPDLEFSPSNTGNRFINDDQIKDPNTIYAGGHVNFLIREGVNRAVFWTKTFGSPRYTLKGNLTTTSKPKVLPSPIGLFLTRPDSAVPIPDSVSTKVGFVDTGYIDSYGWFISGRYTPQIEGWYEFESFVQLDAAADGSRMILEVRRNNVRVCHLHMGHASSTLPIGGGGKTPPIEMNGTTDYIELFVFQNSGGTVNVSSDNTSSFFSGKLVGR